jgi:phosphohistidine phosphatase
MRTLYLIRHAKSSWDSPGLRDIDRPLNERGLRDAPFMANLLSKQGIRPDLIVTSPAKRANTTACLFAQSLGYAESDIVRNGDIYEATPLTLLKIIGALPNEAQTVLLFGHNPTFTEIANYFSDNFIDNVPTCGIVMITSDADSWEEMTDYNSRVNNRYFPKELR